MSERSIHVSDTYRPDIDGLRAIAVLAVVLFHFGVPGFSGGFVGVDVFFVISGFLITGLIRSGMERGDFSIVRFYERRIRRIFPALFLVLAATTGLCLLLLLPNDLIQYGKSLIATALFLSNIHFWRGVGYFDNGSINQPLIHTWSLSVEEQFYILFPILLWLMRRKSRTVNAIAIGILALLSLGLSQWASDKHANAAFYLLPSRLWELMAGSLLGLLPVLHLRRRLTSDAVGIVGMSLIAASVVMFTENTRFPGLNATIPCLGACMVILAGTDSASRIARVLSVPPVVGIGLISYSLYLWHWPLLTFGSYFAVFGLSAWQKIGLVGLAGALATASWYLVEQPSRRGVISRQKLFAIAFTVVGTAVLAGALLILALGMPSRFERDVIKALATQDDRRRVMACPDETGPRDRITIACRIGDTGKAATFFVWGDSHSVVLGHPIQHIAQEQDRSGILVSYAACTPLLGVSRADSRGCRHFNDTQLKTALSPEIKEVFLIGRWALGAEGARYGHETGKRVMLEDDAPHALNDNHAIFAAGLERTVKTLREAGKTVVFVNSAPEVAVAVPETLAKFRILHRQANFAPTEADYLRRQAFVMATARDLQARYGIIVIYPHQVLCRTGKCLVELKGAPLYRDHHHLSAAGAKLLEPLLKASFAAADAQQMSRPATARPDSSRTR